MKKRIRKRDNGPGYKKTKSPRVRHTNGVQDETCSGFVDVVASNIPGRSCRWRHSVSTRRNSKKTTRSPEIVEKPFLFIRGAVNGSARFKPNDGDAAKKPLSNRAIKNAER